MRKSLCRAKGNVGTPDEISKNMRTRQTAESVIAQGNESTRALVDAMAKTNMLRKYASRRIFVSIICMECSVQLALMLHSSHFRPAEVNKDKKLRNLLHENFIFFIK